MTLQATDARPIAVDRHRHFVFPNRMRELRRRQGFPKLLPLAAKLRDIPYIRLSKIERGEVFARADELRRIADVLAVAPADLLLDVDAAGFSMERWAEPFRDDDAHDLGEEQFAVKLAAAVRARRTSDRDLTITVLDRDYGLPAVMLSRIENAFKPLGRWNTATVTSLCRLFDVPDASALRDLVEAQHGAGALDGYLNGIADEEVRLGKTRARVAALRQELLAKGGLRAPAPLTVPSLDAPPVRRMLPVVGIPLGDGVIGDAVLPGAAVEAPTQAGLRAFGLRVCRPSLGAAIPGNAVAIVDPDSHPVSGGLAALKEEGGWRLLIVTTDRAGAVIGHSLNPDKEIALDGRDPAELAAVLRVELV